MTEQTADIFHNDSDNMITVAFRTGSTIDMAGSSAGFEIIGYGRYGAGLSLYAVQLEEGTTATSFESPIAVEGEYSVIPYLTTQLYRYNLSGCQIKGIKLEEGTVATDWSPAPEEVADSITQVEQTVEEVREEFTSRIEVLADSITLDVSGSLGSSASIVLSANGVEQEKIIDLSNVREAFAGDTTSVTISGGTITFNSGTIVINSTNFSVSSTGVVRATSGTIGAITLSSTGIYSYNSSYSGSYAGWYRPATITTSSTCFFAGATSNSGTGAAFSVTYGGVLTATGASITGTLTTVDGLYETRVSGGAVNFYYDSQLRGYFRADSLTLSGTTHYGLSLSMYYEQNVSYGDYVNIGGLYYACRTGLMTFSDISANNIFVGTAGFCSFASFGRNITLAKNGVPIRATTSSGSVIDVLCMNSSDQLLLGNNSYVTLLRGSTVYLKNTSTTVTSDRNAKNNIEALPDAYETFFDELVPVRFKYTEGRSGRYHVGYIAQDVEDAFIRAGLDSSDFAGYVNIEGTNELGLAYNEFIALLHQKIKKLEQRIIDLESA